LAEIKFVEETLRDGQQSLWANRMKTETMLPATQMLDTGGYNKIHIISGSAFECCINFLYEDPWERMRLLCQAMPNSEIMVLIRSRHLFGWDRYPNEVIQLMFQCMKNIGIDWVVIFDALNDIRNMEWQCRIAREIGMKAAPALTFTESPIHTNEYYADKARELVKIGVDCITFGDASGLLTPERTRSIIPAIKKAIGDDVPLGFSAHDGTGQCSECYLEAMKAGVDELSTAARPLAYGNSIPSTMDTLRQAAELGLETHVDPEIAARLDEYFYWGAIHENRQPGKKVTFDPKSYAKYAAHQIPGGMMSHLVGQLKELGIEERLPEVLEEAGRVREDLGWPVMVTPFSQFVGVQAVFNVLQGERYKTFPAELPLYARGYYGELAAPIAPKVLDRVLAGSDREHVDILEQMDDKIIAKVQKEHGPFDSDETLLMNIFSTPQNIEKLRKNRVSINTHLSVDTPLVSMIKALSKRKDIKSFRMERPSVKMSMGF
jgi:oxaloacetate decarboxylase (Na+ extruding) subunit alpha